jgi:cellulase/cellobiase CelA1
MDKSVVPKEFLKGLHRVDTAGRSGATTIAAYHAWMQNFAKGLGNRTAIVLLEPDSLALQTCLNATALAERNRALAGAVTAIKAVNPNAKVYLDGGHSAWNPAPEAARRLTAPQRLVAAWNGTATQAGTSVTVRNVGHNGRIAPGGAVSFGFQGALDGPNPAATGFTLNGVACA